MIRMLVGFLIQLGANALGLIVAAIVLDKVTVSATGFVIAVVIFTIVYALAQPFLTQMAVTKAPALRGGVALVATLIGLILTSLISSGLSISGALTWVEATVIVGIIALIGAWLLPIIFVKKKVEERRA